MTSSPVPAGELRALIAAERRELADVLAGLSAEAWDQPTLCAGWRVREVVAHITMPFRYSTARFTMELIRSGGRFHKMADRCARRDATASPDELTAALRDNAAHPWEAARCRLDGIELHAEDIDWSYGTGPPVIGTAQNLALILCGRTLAAGQLRGEPSPRFTHA